MKPVAILLTGFCLSTLMPIFGQTPQPQTPAMAVPTTTVVPMRPRNNQGQVQKRKDIQQQQQKQPTVTPASPAPSVNRRQDRRPHVQSHQQPPAVNYAEAKKRQHHQRHDQGWWKNHFTVIVFVIGQGYYYFDAGYWFPALGYDSQYDTYEYNGPIFTYGNLLPDQVIYNVQRALKDLGYYSGPLTGSMSNATINAIGAFQQDNELEVTGAIDEPTVAALGLY